MSPFDASGPGAPAPAPAPQAATLAMPDSIYPANLPAGYPAYLGYTDGNWATCQQIKHDHPAACHVCLTVTGSTLNADGIDVEPGNPDAAHGAQWAANKLGQAPGSRPVIYASTVGTPGYGMHDVIAHLVTLHVPLTGVRLLSAHYGAGEHICGPGSCGLISVSMDGTQWTDQAPGNNGTLIDMSVLTSSFFTGGPVAPVKAPITVLPPGNWDTPVTLTGGAGGDQYVAVWDGKKWTQVPGCWPVPRA